MPPRQTGRRVYNKLNPWKLEPLWSNLLYPSCIVSLQPSINCFTNDIVLSIGNCATNSLGRHEITSNTMSVDEP